MISIIKATVEDFQSIVDIGNISVAEAHMDSCSPAELNEYLKRNYTPDAVKDELRNPDNIYHLINYKETPVGFSKIILNAAHPNIGAGNVTKLDRIYLLKEFFGLKLGLKLLNFNISLAKNNHQSGIWLYTWVGNKRAVNFYLKAGFIITGSHHFYVTDESYNLNHQMFLNFCLTES